MSRKVGIIMLFVGSEILGLVVGEWFFHLFKTTVPPLALSNFNAGAAHFAFVGSGALTGLVFFLWSLIVVFMRGIWPKGGAAPSRGI
jgi:hypothetical protein